MPIHCAVLLNVQTKIVYMCAHPRSPDQLQNQINKLKTEYKKRRQQLKESEVYRLFVSKNHLSGWNDVMVIDKMIVDKGLFHEALQWDLWEVMHLCVGKRPAQTAPGITSRCSIVTAAQLPPLLPCVRV